MAGSILNIPPGVSSNGTVRVVFIPDGGIVDTAAPKVAELTGGVDISCLLMADGFQPDAEEEAEKDRRLCSKQDYEIPGSTSWTIADLKYIYDVQNPLSASNAAYVAMVPGTLGTLVARWGMDADKAWAAGQVVDLYPVRLGAQRKQAPEANSELKVLQKPFVIGEARSDKKLV